VAGLTQASDTSRAARALVCDQFCVQPGETVVVTADSATDQSAVEAVLSAASGAGAKTLLMLIAQLPYQGKLADPYIPDALASAVAASDVWLDMTFPYMAGSSTHDQAMKAGRARYLLLGDVNAAALRRLFGTVDLDTLFEVQTKFDDLIAQHQGAQCRVTGASGTDISFRLGKPAGKKRRHANTPGTSTVMGSCIFYPEPESVRGVIALDAIFHEYYAVLPTPIRLKVEGDIREIVHIKDHAIVTERSLRRAGNGNYGRVIHLTCGFHPAARFCGQSFIEDIRAIGANAIGLGVPWWEPGGGENHPDGVVTEQSLWVDGEQIVKDGRIVAPADLARAARALEQAVHSSALLR
jgi:leucyl aminopeptidase (aminopeptidase T)